MRKSKAGGILVTLITLLVLSSAFVGCSNKQGCQDPYALNFDADAKEEGMCNFTNVIFYAASNRKGGNGLRIEKIEVYHRNASDDQLIGTITGLEGRNPEPTGCMPSEKSVVYEFQSGIESPTFNTRYYYVDGTDAAGPSYDTFRPDQMQECILQNLTL